MAKVADSNRYGMVDIGVILDELVVDMEFIQRNGVRIAGEGKEVGTGSNKDSNGTSSTDSSSESNTNTSSGNGEDGTSSSTQVAPPSTRIAGTDPGRDAHTIKVPTDLSPPPTSTSSAPQALRRPGPSPGPGPGPVKMGASKNAPPCVLLPLYHTSAPVVMAVRSYSVDIDLRPCLKAVRQSMGTGNTSREEMEGEGGEEGAIAPVPLLSLRTSGGQGADQGGDNSYPDWVEYDHGQGVLVEVAMGVVVEDEGDDSDVELPRRLSGNGSATHPGGCDGNTPAADDGNGGTSTSKKHKGANRGSKRRGKRIRKNDRLLSDDTVYQTVYVGSSYRFIESGLSNDCKYR